uniref:Uncharacterized protein n=1 Tax=Ditylenchus dipsaci TaxID=166011 RepID=A0A915EE33_9BILA
MGSTRESKRRSLNHQKPGPYGTNAFGACPVCVDVDLLPSVTLKVFTDYVWPRLLRMGLRKLGIQISEQVSRKGRKRAVKKVDCLIFDSVAQKRDKNRRGQRRGGRGRGKTTELSMATPW